MRAETPGRCLPKYRMLTVGRELPPACGDIHSTERHLSGLPNHCNREAER